MTSLTCAGFLDILSRGTTMSAGIGEQAASSHAPRAAECALVSPVTLSCRATLIVPSRDLPQHRGESSKGGLNSSTVALPVIDAADRSSRVGVPLLLKNVLLCREPLYGVGEWAARYAPEALGFADTQLPSLNDDRVGRCLDRLFRSDVTSLVWRWRPMWSVNSRSTWTSCTTTPPRSPSTAPMPMP